MEGRFVPSEHVNAEQVRPGDQIRVGDDAVIVDAVTMARAHGWTRGFSVRLASGREAWTMHPDAPVERCVPCPAP